jgi:hypothetical protein
MNMLWIVSIIIRTVHSTNKWTLVTSNIDFGYLREVTLSEFPHLTKKDFAMINENNSLTSSEIITILP